jgi:hypothetical protein
MIIYFAGALSLVDLFQMFFGMSTTQQQVMLRVQGAALTTYTGIENSQYEHSITVGTNGKWTVKNVASGETTGIGTYQANSGTTAPKFDLNSITNCAILTEDCTTGNIVEGRGWNAQTGCDYEVELDF